MEEIWKPIKNYEDLYVVSNIGRVYGLKRKKIVKPFLTNFGYYRISLSRDGKNKKYFLHRVVAETFIPNPNNYPQVNHIDEDKTNNSIDNLEWCTVSYNCGYGSRPNRLSKLKSKAIAQYDLNNNLITVHRSAFELYKTHNFDYSTIRKCCRGLLDQAYGFRWRDLGFDPES